MRTHPTEAEIQAAAKDFARKSGITYAKALKIIRRAFNEKWTTL